MIILFECPKSLIFEPHTISGANKISQIFFNMSLSIDKLQFIFITDAPKKECLALTKLLCKDKPHQFCHYHDLRNLIEENDILPTAAFISDINIERMLHFRNLNNYSFPVIGLIHSLGIPLAFQQLTKIFPIMKSNDAFICPSHHTKETLTKFGCPENQSIVIHFGYDKFQFFPLKGSQAALRKKLKLPEKKTIMLLLTRLTPCLKMDFTPLIRLLPELVKENPKLKLYIVGTITDKKYVSQLKKYIKQLNLSKHVSWCTKPNQNKIVQYYQAADFFVSLSDAAGETYGLTITEAMACGLPVIISDFSGYEMHFDDAEEGFYIPTTSGSIDLDKPFYYHDLASYGDIYAQSIALDKDILKDKILALSKSKRLRSAMGKKAREKVENRNSIARCFNYYCNYFKLQSMMPCEQVTIKVKKQPIQKLLKHSTSYILSLEDLFELDENYRYSIEHNLPNVMFEKHMNRYTLITKISQLLYKKNYSLKQIISNLKANRSDVEKTLLYLMKHFFVKLTKTEKVARKP